MYLSKVFIPYQKPKSVYDIHQVLQEEALNHQKQKCLYRIEQQRAGYGAEILLQSEQEPIATRKVQIVASKLISLKFSEQQVLRFLLVANPIKTIRDENGRKHLDDEGKVRINSKTGKEVIKPCRVPLLDESEQIEWLKHKEIAIAADVKIKFQDAAYLNEIVIRPCAPLYFYRKESGGGKITPVAFEGILTVQRPNELQKIIEFGIGAAKAFGCGLLSVART